MIKRFGDFRDNVFQLEEYEGVENRSASLAEYGQGAIDVLLHYQ